MGKYGANCLLYPTGRCRGYSQGELSTFTQNFTFNPPLHPSLPLLCFCLSVCLSFCLSFFLSLFLSFLPADSKSLWSNKIHKIADLTVNDAAWFCSVCKELHTLYRNIVFMTINSWLSRQCCPYFYKRLFIWIHKYILVYIYVYICYNSDSNYLGAFSVAAFIFLAVKCR